MGFPAGSEYKESACNAGDLDSIPGLGRSPGGGHGNPPQYSCLENPHGQKSLAGDTLWGLKELAMTEQLSTALKALWASLVAQCVKKPPAIQETGVQSLGGGRSPGEGNGNPLQYFCLGNPLDNRRLVGYSPWGHKESDIT